MRNSLAVVLLFAAVSAGPALWGQEQRSQLEAYGGYYYARFNVNANVPGIAPSATYNETAAVANSSTTSTIGSVWWEIWAVLGRPVAGAAHLPEECSPIF